MFNYFNFVAIHQELQWRHLYGFMIIMHSCLHISTKIYERYLAQLRSNFFEVLQLNDALQLWGKQCVFLYLLLGNFFYMHFLLPLEFQKCTCNSFFGNMF
jgi:hypothetical protein